MAVKSTDRPRTSGTGPRFGPYGDGHGARTSLVSAYPYPAAAPPQPRGAADPTAVMGRRTGAWVVDVLIYALIMAFLGPTPLSPLAEYYDVEDVDDACEILQEGDQYDAATCVVINDRAYVTSGADVAVQTVVGLALFVGYCLLQGATGRTPGKALFGVKVVDEQGRTPAPAGRSAHPAVGRRRLPVVPPLVGFVVGLTTPGHRQVGDMAVKTFVVDKGHTGPVVVPGWPVGHQPGGYPARRPPVRRAGGAVKRRAGERPGRPAPRPAARLGCAGPGRPTDRWSRRAATGRPAPAPDQRPARPAFRRRPGTTAPDQRPAPQAPAGGRRQCRRHRHRPLDRARRPAAGLGGAPGARPAPAVAAASPAASPAGSRLRRPRTPAPRAGAADPALGGEAGTPAGTGGPSMAPGGQAGPAPAGCRPSTTPVGRRGAPSSGTPAGAGWAGTSAGVEAL